MRSLSVPMLICMATLGIGSRPALGAQAQGPSAQAPAVEAFTAVDGQRLPLVAEPRPSAMAAGLESASRCHPEIRRASLVFLRWRPPSAEGLLDQRVDISKFRDGFAKGSFEATRPLPRATEAVAVEAPEPGVNYYWRVLTQTVDGWVSSPVQRFEVPICPWDGKELGDAPPGAARKAPGDAARRGRSPEAEGGGR